jgi:outer membrane protein
MKNLVLSLSILLISAGTSLAQRFAYVDTEYILEQIKEYSDAQKKLDGMAMAWQEEIDAKFDQVSKLYNKYQAEEFLLTEEMKRKREEEIILKEKEANELQRKRFGFEGDLFKKRQELIQPIQERVYNAIEKVATNLGYDFIFDKASGGATMLYTNSKFDLSEQVLKNMGVK